MTLNITGRRAPEVDRASVGDRWTYEVPTVQIDYCRAEHPDEHWMCSRVPGHSATQHVAGDGGRVLAVWPVEVPEPEDKPLAIGDEVWVDADARTASGSEVYFGKRCHAKIIDMLPRSDNARVQTLDGTVTSGRYSTGASTQTVGLSYLTRYTPPTDKPAAGDRVRITAYNPDGSAHPGMDGGTGTLARIDTDPHTSLPFWVEIDGPTAERRGGGYYAGMGIWASAVEKIAEIEPKDDVPADLDPVGVQTAADALAVTAERDRLAAEVARLTAAAATHEQWKSDLARDAHSYAEDQGWCSEFDDFMVDHGLPGRARTIRVNTRVTFETSIEVSAHSDAEAMGQVNQMSTEDIRAHIERESNIVSFSARGTL